MVRISDDILYRVEKPSRYVGGELNEIIKNPKDVNIRFAFCFPDVYEVGMSHLGTRILYHTLNERKDTYCERVFAPWPDMENLMRENNIATFISYITNIFLIVCAIILLVYKYVLAIFIVFICVFSIFTTIKSRKRAMYIVMQGLLKKQEIILRKKYMKNKSISVYCESYSVDLLKFLEKDKFHIFYVLDNNMKILYILKEDEFINILNNYGNIKLKDYYNTRNK